MKKRPPYISMPIVLTHFVVFGSPIKGKGEGSCLKEKPVIELPTAQEVGIAENEEEQALLGKTPIMRKSVLEVL